MQRADSADVSWDMDKKRWNVRVKLGEEVIRRPLDKAPHDAADDMLRSLAVQTARDEGYDLDPDSVAVAHGGPV